MSIIQMLIAQMFSGDDVGDIGHSLRFRSSASAYLSRTITTDATTTYFAAVKRGKLGAVFPIFDTNIKFNANDTLTAFGLTTTAVFRDTTSWLFIHVSNGGLYVNGVSFGAVTTSALTNPRIGFDGTNYFDGYIARLGCVAGSSSAYTNFGYFNTNINEWVSKSQSQVKAVVDAGGTNSFMLDFDNGTSTTTLGYDKSSKGNNWTCNNISLTAGTTYDWMLDVPGNSYCTMNPLDPITTKTYTDGNLRATATGYNFGHANYTVSAGKWYWEVTPLSGVATYGSHVAVDFGYTVANQSPGTTATDYAFQENAFKRNNNVTTAYGASYSDNDVIGVALDFDAGTLVFYKNGVSQGTAYSTLSGTATPHIGSRSGAGGTVFALNFGQQPFAYTPPTGFNALCQANLLDAGTVIVSGSFTGNANANGPFVWMNGVPDTLTINGNAVTFGTHADKLANGFKLRTSSASYNVAGSNTWTATITSDTKNIFKYNTAEGNP